MWKDGCPAGAARRALLLIVGPTPGKFANGGAWVGSVFNDEIRRWSFRRGLSVGADIPKEKAFEI